MSLPELVRKRKRETRGDDRRGSVKKAMPEKSAVVVSTVRLPFRAPPKFGSKKYFCFTSQVMNSSAPAGTQPAAEESCLLPALVGSCSLQSEWACLRYRRCTSPTSTSLVLLRMSRKSKWMMEGNLSTPLV